MTLTILYYFEKKSDFLYREPFRVIYTEGRMELPKNIVDIKSIDYGTNLLDGLIEQMKSHFGLNVGPYKLDEWSNKYGIFCLNLKTEDYNIFLNEQTERS